MRLPENEGLSGTPGRARNAIGSEAQPAMPATSRTPMSSRNKAAAKSRQDRRRGDSRTNFISVSGSGCSYAVCRRMSCVSGKLSSHSSNRSKAAPGSACIATKTSRMSCA